MSVAIAAAPELVGSPTPRIFTPPLRPLTPDTSLGFEAIEFAEQVLGLELLPWQRNFLIAALELRLDGTFRFRTVVLLVGRQSGKSTVAQVLTLWRMCMDGARTVLATAQNLDVSNRTVADVQEIVQGNPELAPMFDKDGRAGGKFWFRLKGDQGETYEMRAVTADRRGARSMTADLVFADELREHTDWEAWNAVEATISTRSRGMILVTSNAGDGRSVVLKALREQGLQAIRDNNHDTKLGLFEWSAPDDCDMHDPRGWVQALPGLGITSLVEDVQSAASRPGNEWGFRTERLCQWRTAAKDAPFSDEEIAACIDDASEIAQDSPIVLAADVAQDRSKTVLAVAGWRTDGLPHVEVIVERAGTEWLPKVLSTELEFDPDLTVMQGRGAPISSIVDLIAAEGVEVTSCQGMESTTACARFSDRLKAGRLRFRDDSSLMLALTEAVKKSVGDAWEWSRKASPVDVSSLVAVTEALWGLEQLELTPAKTPTVTAYGDDYDDWWK